jgi:hypothetical protein
MHFTVTLRAGIEMIVAVLVEAVLASATFEPAASLVPATYHSASAAFVARALNVKAMQSTTRVSLRRVIR